MGVQKLEQSISEIIKDFRQGKVEIELNCEHVHKWVSQFDVDDQKVILEETLQVFQRWYFNKTKIEEFLDNVVQSVVQDENYESVHAIFKNIVFLDMQEKGKSQTDLVQMLQNLVKKKYNCDINVQPQVSVDNKYYIYIDDGLFTGSRLIKDLTRCIEQASERTKIDIWYLISCESGQSYGEEEVKSKAKEKNINIKIHVMNEIHNNKTIKSVNGESVWDPRQDCLWPNKNLNDVPIIKDYKTSLERALGKERPIPYFYRTNRLEYFPGIFSSMKNRDIVERAFLKKGIEIVQKCRTEKGMYPLGYNLYPSAGFGAFCATDLNVPNTCPLVLWWGNIIEKGDVLDNWYPLLPRRTNEKSMTIIDFSNEIPYSNAGREDAWKQVYTTCPACGKGICFENDGGTGFCINCSPDFS